MQWCNVCRPTNKSFVHLMRVRASRWPTGAVHCMPCIISDRMQIVCIISTTIVCIYDIIAMPLFAHYPYWCGHIKASHRLAIINAYCIKFNFTCVYIIQRFEIHRSVRWDANDMYLHTHSPRFSYYIKHHHRRARRLGWQRSHSASRIITHAARTPWIWHTICTFYMNSMWIGVQKGQQLFKRAMHI